MLTLPLNIDAALVLQNNWLAMSTLWYSASKTLVCTRTLIRYSANHVTVCSSHMNLAGKRVLESGSKVIFLWILEIEK